ncbi:MAG: 2-oxoglutarate oxidoreductase subunit KorB [Alphaproteobacteria bacterium MarineAlpha11_Bin1]|nr:MAG: 2-oxoglutarate oxidoreductase subunit KorB [Alphaproteobacteria bacterium MarineAlpha11_Bin1]|tara:strand:+ start:4507 stop:5541 length:1035 start_codon:yes stop_codon:yes gene_type:complete
MNVETPVEPLKPNDYASDQEVRWCPGCGDYAIVKGVHRTLAELQIPLEKLVFFSGIGCAARFPYYMASYGFHTIHGRAPALATGAKLANPDLDIWVVMGDGDALSIGGNHTMHAIRRNVDINMLLFNNEIYGLTKGQYSPTSQLGTRSPSTPQGSVDAPLSPLNLALGAGARFVARTFDTNQKQMPGVLKAAHAHKGASLVEIIQNCIVYNDGAFDGWTGKKVVGENSITVENNKPLIFGADSNKGIASAENGFGIRVVTIGEDGITEDDILVHDETNKILAVMLADMKQPEFPVALGVLYNNPGEAYDDAVHEQLAGVKETTPAGTINEMLRKGRTWTVSEKV